MANKKRSNELPRAVAPGVPELTITTDDAPGGRSARDAGDATHQRRAGGTRIDPMPAAELEASRTVPESAWAAEPTDAGRRPIATRGRVLGVVALVAIASAGVYVGVRSSSVLDALRTVSMVLIGAAVLIYVGAFVLWLRDRRRGPVAPAAVAAAASTAAVSASAGAVAGRDPAAAAQPAGTPPRVPTLAEVAAEIDAADRAAAPVLEPVPVPVPARSLVGAVVPPPPVGAVVPPPVQPVPVPAPLVPIAPVVPPPPPAPVPLAVVPAEDAPEHDREIMDAIAPYTEVVGAPVVYERTAPSAAAASPAPVSPSPSPSPSPAPTPSPSPVRVSTPVVPAAVIPPPPPARAAVPPPPPPPSRITRPAEPAATVAPVVAPSAVEPAVAPLVVPPPAPAPAAVRPSIGAPAAGVPPVVAPPAVVPPPPPVEPTVLVPRQAVPADTSPAGAPVPPPAPAAPAPSAPPPARTAAELFAAMTAAGPAVPAAGEPSLVVDPVPLPIETVSARAEQGAGPPADAAPPRVPPPSRRQQPVDDGVVDLFAESTGLAPSSPTLAPADHVPGWTPPPPAVGEGQTLGHLPTADLAARSAVGSVAPVIVYRYRKWVLGQMMPGAAFGPVDVDRSPDEWLLLATCGVATLLAWTHEDHHFTYSVEMWADEILPAHGVRIRDTELARDLILAAALHAGGVDSVPTERLRMYDPGDLVTAMASIHVGLLRLYCGLGRIGPERVLADQYGIGPGDIPLH